MAGAVGGLQGRADPGSGLAGAKMAAVTVGPMVLVRGAEKGLAMTVGMARAAKGGASSIVAIGPRLVLRRGLPAGNRRWKSGQQSRRPRLMRRMPGISDT
jgi:hypothetical protein